MSEKWLALEVMKDVRVKREQNIREKMKGVPAVVLPLQCVVPWARLCCSSDDIKDREVTEEDLVALEKALKLK